MLGTKLTVLEQVVFERALEAMKENEVPPTLARMVMGNVYRRFADSAVVELSARAVLGQPEPRTGTVEELKEYMGKEMAQDEDIHGTKG